MRNRVFQLVGAFLLTAFVIVFLPHFLKSVWPDRYPELLWRGGLTAAWAIVSFALVTGIRRAGMRQVRATPEERRTIVHFSLQMLSAGLVIAAFAVVADIWNLSLTGIALGGAVTGVVLGLAAQSTLGNVIAGAMLLSLRPMRIGEWVTLRSWMSGGVDVTGRIEEINFFYTVLRENGVRRVVPNSAVTVSQIAVDECQEGFTQSLTLPLRLPPEAALAILAPYRGAEVVDVRQDAYVLRIAWTGDRESRAERLQRLATLLCEPGSERT